MSLFPLLREKAAVLIKRYIISAMSKNKKPRLAEVFCFNKTAEEEGVFLLLQPPHYQFFK